MSMKADSSDDEKGGKQAAVTSSLLEEDGGDNVHQSLHAECDSKNLSPKYVVLTDKGVSESLSAAVGDGWHLYPSVASCGGDEEKCQENQSAMRPSFTTIQEDDDELGNVVVNDIESVVRSTTASREEFIISPTLSLQDHNAIASNDEGYIYPSETTGQETRRFRIAFRYKKLESTFNSDPSSMPGATRVRGIGVGDDVSVASGDGTTAIPPQLGEDMANNTEQDLIYSIVTHGVLKNDVTEALDVQPMKDRTRRDRLAVVLVLVAVVVVSIVIGVEVRIHRTIPVAVMGRTPTITPASSPRFQAFRLIISDNIPYSSDFWNPPYTPQYWALHWIANEDLAKLNVSASVETIITRYVLAVFYFQTNGPNWTNQSNFLSASSIYEWHNEFNGIGSFCSNETNVLHQLILRRNVPSGKIPTEVFNPLQFSNFGSL